MDAATASVLLAIVAMLQAVWLARIAQKDRRRTVRVLDPRRRAHGD